MILFFHSLGGVEMGIIMFSSRVHLSDMTHVLCLFKRLFK